MLTPWLGRAAARTLVPAALVTAPFLVSAGASGAASAAPAASTVVSTSTVSTASLKPVALTTSTTLTPAQSWAIRHAAWLRVVAARHRALVARKDAAVVRWALAHVGDRYRAGSTGPYAFDCSGLTLAAWRAQGVRLPHYSVAQWRHVRHISRRSIRPGDLVFFFRGGAHHVAIYVGRGLMVSADRPGVGVRLEPYLFSWFGAHFSGVGRVIS